MGLWLVRICVTHSLELKEGSFVGFNKWHRSRQNVFLKGSEKEKKGINT